jgi:hypothetical protein
MNNRPACFSIWLSAADHTDGRHIINCRRQLHLSIICLAASIMQTVINASAVVKYGCPRLRAI